MSEESNLASAIEREAKSKDKAISNEVSADGSPADKNVLIRIPSNDRERWKQAADKTGVSMSQMIRDAVNSRVSDILDCPHPLSSRRFYPWSEFCLACNTRLK